MGKDEQEYCINWQSLSNDKLLEVWLMESISEIGEREVVEKILIERNVIKKHNK